MLRVGRLSSFLGLVCLLVGMSACGNTGDNPGGDTDAGTTDSGPVLRCSSADDPDGDYISTMDEGTVDTDGDGTPNYQDTDSDGDTITDRDEAGDSNCESTPRDTDGDSTPDFLDRDANGDGIDDQTQLTEDFDHDGTPDARDNDIDGDGISNAIEIGTSGTPADTDGDSMPDFKDDDSDGDTISDAAEGAGDPDGDHIENFRDLDSDGDTVIDALEAGDGDVATPPASCANEIDPVTGDVMPDGFANFNDADSDNDGLSDGQEASVGADPCDTDSDDDGISDLFEGAYVSVNCPDGTSGDFCDCAHNAGCTIPNTDYYMVLPYMGTPQVLPLEFGTTIRVADVFFITDTTGSMGGTVDNVKATVTTPGSGLIDRIRETIPDAWFGGGQHDDMPFGGYGAGEDEPFILAIGMTSPTESAAVQTAFNGIGLHGGSDGAESQTMALFEIVTGEGGTWSYSGGFGGGATYTMPNYRSRCLDTGWGAPCFREASLPIVVHFTDICSHNGPPGEDLGSCDDYTGITPSIPTWSEMVAALNLRGAKYIGANASGRTCVGATGPLGSNPCYFMKQTAEATGSVDIDHNPLVYDLPNTASTIEFANTIVEAIQTIATRVPFDVDTGLRDDASDAAGIDATRFIKRRIPGCNATPAIDPCWVEPVGVTHELAVALVDTSTFYGVIPGTLVTFQITFQNDFYAGSRQSELFIAYIDVRGGGSAILDTRTVYIVVPANPVPLG